MKSILILEDDEMISDIYKRQLEKVGFKVDVLTSGEGVAEKIVKEQPDVALLDLMINVGGIEILKKLKGIQLKTKLIVFSNNQDPETEKEALDLGASAFLIKADYTPKKLLGFINQLIGAA